MGLDQDIEMRRMVMEALRRFDHEIHRTNGRGLARHERGTFGDGSSNYGENNAKSRDGEDIGDLDDEIPNRPNVEQEAKYENRMVEMFQEAHTPLYARCPTNKIALQPSYYC
jgi:hypothetical protein